MKTFPKTLVLALVCAASPALLRAQAAAAPAPVATPAPKVNPACAGQPQKTAYISVTDAIQTTDEGKKQIADLQARFAPTKAALQKLNDDIQAKQKQYDQGGNTLSESVKADLQRQIQSMQRDLQQQSENANTDWQSAQSDMVQQIGSKMMNILEQYSEDHCVDSIFDDSVPWPQSPLLYAQKDLDITGTVIALYNQRYPLTNGAPASLSSPTARPPAPSTPAKPSTLTPKPGGGGGGGL